MLVYPLPEGRKTVLARPVYSPVINLLPKQYLLSLHGSLLNYLIKEKIVGYQMKLLNELNNFFCRSEKVYWHLKINFCFKSLLKFSSCNDISFRLDLSKIRFILVLISICGQFIWMIFDVDHIVHSVFFDKQRILTLSSSVIIFLFFSFPFFSSIMSICKMVLKKFYFYHIFEAYILKDFAWKFQ